MSDKVFIDTNIALYLLSDDDKKANIAGSLLSNQPLISTQVVNEFANVYSLR